MLTFINLKNFEKFYPLFFAALITSFYFLYVKYPVNSTSLTTAITFSSVFVGFCCAIAGIIMSSNSEAINFIKKIKKLNPLLNFIWHAILWNFILLVTSSIAVFICSDSSVMPAVPSTIWVFISTYALFLTFRCVYITMILLKSSINN